MKCLPKFAKFTQMLQNLANFKKLPNFGALVLGFIEADLLRVNIHCAHFSQNSAHVRMSKVDLFGFQY